ncbi:germination protein YpeB [Paenibacillus sp. MBLB4367]|uniref:germination protein YpeB n=1 Tax=Paenibacillus sp. MBLB4367 TaxID=3384767 RepID=UPI003907F0CC
MYKRLSAVLFPVCALGLVGAAVWGYQENQEKNAILIKAENQYQRSFHDLSYHMEKLNSELGNTMALNTTSNDMYRKGLINVWRLTSQAQNEISQLPLTLLPFSKTEEFLDNIAKFTYATAVRDLSKQPLSQEEIKTLSTLHERSKEIKNELRSVQSEVLAKNLRWMDVEVAIASESKKMDNVIVDGFQLVDKKVGEYSDVDWGPTLASMNQKRNFSMLSGNDVTADEIKDKAAQFLGDGTPLTVTENGAGTETNTFSVTGKRPGSGEDVYLDYAKKGGKLLFFMSTRDVKNKTLDIRGARDAALEFLDKNGYDGMTIVSADEYENVANLTFAGKQNDVILYPDKLTVKVALDNGEVTAFQGTDYVLQHKERKLDGAKLTEEQAKKQLNPSLAIESHVMALILNDMNEEVLCHQFTGKLNGADYNIYLNADTGMEEKIESIPQAAKQAGA